MKESERLQEEINELLGVQIAILKARTRLHGVTVNLYDLADTNTKGWCKAREQLRQVAETLELLVQEIEQKQFDIASKETTK